MAAKEAWPPKSPRAALLSSPSGRRKFLANGSDSQQRSPMKPSATSPNLLDRLRAARNNNDYFEDSEPLQVEDEDEETLKLQLAAIEAKLKLKRLQQSKTKAEIGRNTPHPPSSRPLSTTVLTGLQEPAEILSQQPSRSVQVGLSPTRKTISTLEPKSPSRVRLGIDKGLKASDVSLRRAKTTIERIRSARATDASRPTSRVPALGSQRSTASSSNAGTVKSFSERMSTVRENDRSREAQRQNASLGRSRSFKLDKDEIDTYRQLAEEQPETSRSPTRPNVQQAYSRADVLQAKEKAEFGTQASKKSRTEPDLRQPSPRPSSRGPVNGSTGAEPDSQPDSALFEGYSGFHLTSRVLPHSFLKRTLPEDQYTILQIPDLLREIKSPDYELPTEVGDYVVFAVVASKSTPRDHRQKVEEKTVGTNDWERKWEDGSQNQRKFIAMTLTDLKWSLDLYLFGTAVPRYHRLTPGTVVAILNPSIMPPKKGKEDTGAFSLSLNDGDDTVLEIGTAKHLGYCNALRKDGKECGQWINTAKAEICEWHLNLQLSKAQSGRMGINTGSNGNKLNSRAFLFDSRSKGSHEGEGQTGLLPRAAGEKYDRFTGNHYFVSNSNPGFSARSQSRQNGPANRMLDLDDPFVGEGQLSEARDRKALLKLRKERQQKEEDIAKKLSTFEGGRAGSEYLRHRSGASTPAGGPGPDGNGGTRRSGLATKATIMRSRSDANESRKRAAESVRLSPVKKTRFLTEKGIRVAGRDSLGVTNVDDDDELDIV